MFFQEARHPKIMDTTFIWSEERHIKKNEAMQLQKLSMFEAVGVKFLQKLFNFSF